MASFILFKGGITILTIIKDGYNVDLKQLNLECIDFSVQSINGEHSFDKVQGQDGIANIDTTYNERNLFGEFHLETDSIDEFLTKRDEVYKLFSQRNELTIIDNEQPHKKWIVQVSEPFIIDNDLSATNAIFNINFVSKSIYAYGEKVKETITTDESTFIIYNSGDTEIEGNQHHLLITFKGNSEKLRIRNNYNDTQFQYLKTTENNDTIKLDRVYPYKNNKSIFEDTEYKRKNYGYITLERGSNQFNIYGVTGKYTVTFEFIPLYI